MLIKIDPLVGEKSRLSCMRQGFFFKIHYRPLILSLFVVNPSSLSSLCLSVSVSVSLSVASPLHSCPFLVKHLTSCIPVIGGGLFVFVVITLLQTSFTDPGILPRATPDEAADIEKQIGKSQLESDLYNCLKCF